MPPTSPGSLALNSSPSKRRKEGTEAPDIELGDQASITSSSTFNNLCSAEEKVFKARLEEFLSKKPAIKQTAGTEEPCRHRYSSLPTVHQQPVPPLSSLSSASWGLSFTSPSLGVTNFQPKSKMPVSENQALVQQITDLEAKIGKLSLKNHALMKENENLTALRLEQIKQFQEYQRQAQSIFDSNKKLIEEHVAEKEQGIQALMDLIKRDEENLSRVTSQNAELTQKLEAAQEEKKELAARSAMLARENEEQVTLLTGQNSLLEKRIIDSNAKIVEMENNISGLNKDIKRLQKKKETLSNQVSKLTEQNSVLEEQIASSRADSKEKIAQAQATISSLRREVKTLTETNNKQEREARTVHKNLEKILEECKKEQAATVAKQEELGKKVHDLEGRMKETLGALAQEKRERQTVESQLRAELTQLHASERQYTQTIENLTQQLENHRNSSSVVLERTDPFSDRSTSPTTTLNSLSQILFVNPHNSPNNSQRI